MNAIFNRLWTEQDGAIISAEMMLILSLLVIGMIVGLSALRDSIVTELADVAQALANFDQSYSYSGVSGHHAFSGGGEFSDSFDFCDRKGADDRGNSKCVQICSSHFGGGESGGGHHGGGHGKW